MNCDCQYELIYQVVNGCIYQNGCGQIYMEYGNMSITFNEIAFSKFSDFIMKFDMDNANQFLRPPNNKILLQPGKNANSYALSLSEMKAIKKLVKNAQNILNCLAEVKMILK